MLRFKDTSIKYSYMFIMVLIIVPIMMAFYIITCKTIKNNIGHTAQIAVDQSRNSIIESMKLTEKNYELISSHYDSIMRDSLKRFSDEYEKNKGDVSKIDIQAIKHEYNGQMDFYVIDQNGVIVESTFPKVMGLDFKGTPKFYEELTKIRLGDDIAISNVTSERRTHELRKWGYMPTSDHEYVLEVGVSSAELKKYIKEFDYVGAANQLKNNNPFIKEVYVYDWNYFKLGYEMQEIKSHEVLDILDYVMENEKDYKIYGELGFVERDYVHVNTFKGRNLEDSEKVIEIVYNYDMVALEFNEMRRNIIGIMAIYAFASLVLITILTGKYIANPLVTLAGKVKNISWSNLNVDIDYDGKNEIGVLSKSFVEMAGKLSDTLISKKYLENIIDSVGDMFIVLDSDFNVKRVNEYATSLLGYEKREILGKPIENLFGGNFSKEEVSASIKEGDTAENIENVLKKSDGCELVVLSSFSALYDEDRNVIGYACNSKDISKTKEILSKLEYMNLKLKENESHLIEKSKKDHLTGVFNRGHIFSVLERIVKNTPETYNTMSIIMCDADHFKEINDRHGHQAGDHVLVVLTDIIKKNLRKVDYVGRYGGEEFLIVLPNTAEKEAFIVAERIRKDVESAKFKEGSISMTISGGIAQYRKDEDYKNLIKRADDFLYKAKREGRNRIKSGKLKRL